MNDLAHPVSHPQRLLPLSPNVSMILFALGADELVIGRTNYCVSSIENFTTIWNVPRADVEHRLQYWRTLPDAGAWPAADRDCVVALKPDLILSSGTGPLAATDAATFGVAPGALINFDTRTLADLDRQIATIGELIGKPDAARKLIARLAERRAAALVHRKAPHRRPSVLFEYCVCIKYHPDPARRFANPGRFVMAGGHLAPELIQLAGGEPLFTKPGDTVAWTDFNDIKTAEPGILLIFDCNGCPNALKHPVADRPGWRGLAAFSSQAVFRPRLNIANPNLCYPAALAELSTFIAEWEQLNPEPLTHT